MSSVRSSTCALFCMCLVALAPACSLKQRAAGPTGQERKVIDDTAKQAQTYIAHGNYKQALVLFSKAYDKYHIPGMRSSFARTTEQLRSTADAAYQNKDFGEAGNIYFALSESGIAARDFAQSLSFDNEYVNRQLSLCSKALLESGLMKYREQKLDNAIAIWKKALAFDPENKRIQDAIDTATMQLQTLKSLK